MHFFIIQPVDRADVLVILYILPRQSCTYFRECEFKNVVELIVVSHQGLEVVECAVIDFRSLRAFRGVFDEIL